MKMRLSALLLALGFFAGVDRAAAQEARFFRISGPTAITITSFRPDGTLVWGNAKPGATYTAQTASSLPGGTNWVDYVQLPVSQAVNTNKLVDFNPPSGMAFIPAGSFTMGNYLIIGNSITNDRDFTNANPTNTTVSAFYMDVNLVSYSVWTNVYAYATNHGYSFAHSASGQAANYPVYNMNWYDCVKWCNARSQQAGLRSVYFTDAGMTQVYTNGNTDEVYVNWGGPGYRLPTEAEWEKAARGGLIGQRFPWGDTISWKQANYWGDPLSLDPQGYAYDLATAFGYDPAFDTGRGPITSPVGSFAPNGYGLYDMAGNAFEFCWDWYDEPYAGGSDPRGPATPDPNYGSFRVLRGGSSLNYAYWCRAAYRVIGNPASSYESVGFRSVQPSGQ